MTSSAADELSEALTRLEDERETILEEIATLERAAAEKHEALEDLREKIDALQKTLAVLRPDQAPALERRTPPPPRMMAMAAPSPRLETSADAEADEATEAEPEPEPEPEPPTDYSHLSRQTAVLGVLAGAARALHYQEIAQIIGAPASSVSPILSHLKYREMVELTEPGVYLLAPALPVEAEQEVHEALRAVAAAIVDDQQWDILEAILEMDERLPFVGFEHFRRNRLAHAASAKWANDRLTHGLMKELIERDWIEVYHKDNPRNPDFPTAAVRLTDEGLDEISD